MRAELIGGIKFRLKYRLGLRFLVLYESCHFGSGWGLLSPSARHLATPLWTDPPPARPPAEKYRSLWKRLLASAGLSINLSCVKQATDRETVCDRPTDGRTDGRQ